MRSIALSSALLMSLALSVSAQESRVPPTENAPTFSKDVAPIFYSKCVTCHRPGEVAPMSLITYKDARPWARAIRDRVVAREMPPWHADPAHGSFRNDRSLTPAQIDTIAKWVDGGARQGDPSKMPAMPAFASGWQIGTPDIVFEMPTEFKVPADGTVDYQYFEVPTNFKEDRWIAAGEVRAGNPEHVHHIIVSVIEPPGNTRPNVMSIRAIPDGSAAAAPRTLSDAQRAQLQTAARRANAVSLVNWAVGEDAPVEDRVDLRETTPQERGADRNHRERPVHDSTRRGQPSNRGGGHVQRQRESVDDASAHASAREGHDVHGDLSGRATGGRAARAEVRLRLADRLLAGAAAEPAERLEASRHRAFR
jgi:hypothetical protein